MRITAEQGQRAGHLPQRAGRGLLVTLTSRWLQTASIQRHNLVKVDVYLCWMEAQFVEVICVDGAALQTSTEILHNLMKASRLN